MVCIASIRDFIARATSLRAFSPSKLGRFRVRVCGRDLDVGPAAYFPQSRRRFQTIPVVKMMVDSGTGSTHLPITAPVQKPVEDAIFENDDLSYGAGTCKSEDRSLSYGYYSFTGRRPTMEDFYDIKTTRIQGQTVSLFGVFDGHAGSRAARYLKEHLFDNLLNHPKFMTDTKLAIRETYRKTDSDFLDSEISAFREDGSTSCTAILIGNQLFVANVGDSRAVISKGGKAIPLSEDHKPNRSDERQRIEDAGGVVIWAGTWRVNGVLAMSRAFGNRILKQFVEAEPDIKEEVIDDELELLVLATDGIWDVLTNEGAISLAKTEEAPETAARRLGEYAYSHGSADNITSIVVRFHHDENDDDAVVPTSSPSTSE
ncbi:Protein phosphatase 2C family protein [Rhynchospora pubera]|uniref:protein-serine/threonine phosphatase n=1 Tax=Rhynchospora pubera TaxID=906938 RepID=A0AAV8F9C2_9POAL|nr:Protein phosphatase 2C family protein [Rhynchospora pubera]